MARVEALFLLVPPMAFDTEFHAKSFDYLLRFLQSARDLPSCATNGDRLTKGGSFTVQIQSCPSGLKRKYFGHEMKGWMRRPNVPLLRFGGELPYPGVDGSELSNSDGSRVEVSPEDHLAIWKDVLQEELNVAIQTYICALTIAFPAALRCGANVWLIDGEPTFHEERLVSMASESVEFLVANGIEPGTIDPENVIKWVFSQNGMLDGCSDTPASRALNYFTRLFVREFRNDELSDLVWALGGVEALLVEGGRSSQGQLKEKLGALFEVKADWLHSMIEKTYGFRSRAVHGNRQLRSQFRRNEAYGDRRRNEEYDSVRFALGILILLLQRMIKVGAPFIKFRTILASP